MSTPARRLAAILVLLLSLAIIAVLSLRAIGVPATVKPSASPTPVVPTATPLTSETTNASASPIAPGAFAEIEEQVAELRGLAPPEIGLPEVITRTQLAVELEAIFDRDMPGDEVERDNFTLRALGLLDEGQDLRVLTEQLYGTQVLGFYDPIDRRMVVVSDTGLTAQARVTYAHEYTHALQDEAFDAVGEAEPTADDDAGLAFVGLVEGDASLAMTLWAFEQLSPDELLGISQTPIPDTSGTPDWMIRQLEFPYLAGAEFVAGLWTTGGWEAVDAAYEDPPASTEQVLHPELYAAGEAPLDLAAPDLVTALDGTSGGTWELVEETTVGEAMIAIWLGAMGLGDEDASAAAGGWGGDRLAVAGGPDDAWSLAWRIGWDAPSEAQAFEDAFGARTATLPFASDLVRLSPTETLVLHASSDEVLEASRSAAGS